MVESSSLNGGRATAEDVEKGEVDVETGEVSSDSEQEQWQDLEEGEVSDMVEEDLEKRGEMNETEVPNLLEPLLSVEEAQHEELAAASKPLILTEKVVVSLFVVCFVLVEAYFVGRSFRNWINSNEHLHDDGNSMSRKEFGPIGSSVQLPLLVPIDGGGGGGGKESIATPEPFEDFLEGSLNSGVGTARKGLFFTKKMSILAKKLSSGRTRSSPALDSNSQISNPWAND